MIAPSVLGLGAPVIVGLVLGVPGVIGLLVGALTCGFCVAVFMANAGGSWDNAKKYIEAGALGGKGTDAHKAAVVGDTVGDPFKDTSGPSLNILIKLMSMVSVVAAGLIVQFGVSPGGYWTAGVLIVLAVGGYAAWSVIRSMKQKQSGRKCTPAPEPQAAEAPAPKTSALEPPASEAPVSETPSADAPASEAPAADTPTPETPAAEPAEPETPASETPADETPRPETPTPETSVPEPPDPETPSGSS
jgi:hypothetical protein